VGVLASLGSEGSSRITYEYMASGTPIVASNVGCIPEVLTHEQTGLIVAPGDPQALAQAIVRIFNEPGLADRLRSNALERARTFHNRQRWLNEILEVYHIAINARR
jgi:glycosyltransferase involved in cell wall biosynthesis